MVFGLSLPISAYCLAIGQLGRKYSTQQSYEKWNPSVIVACRNLYCQFQLIMFIYDILRVSAYSLQVVYRHTLRLHRRDNSLFLPISLHSFHISYRNLPVYAAMIDGSLVKASRVFLPFPSYLFQKTFLAHIRWNG